MNAPEKLRPRTRFDTVGKPRRRVDGRAKVTGLTKFADDIVLPRMVHCKLLRSPHPHAVIESIDFAKAKASPGVHLVLTGKDFPISYGILPVTQDEYPLANERVRYVGDPVAAVIAKDEQTADEALRLIDVKYRILNTVSSAEEALANPEPRIHDYGEQGNIHRLQAFEFGDVEEALSGSDHVFEDLFFFEGNTHLPLEQHASVAAPDGEGKLTLWSSTQVPHYIHRALARALRIPAAHIRVIACPNGGGFGGKCDLHNHEIVVSRASMILGRPVKICLTREEVFYMHRGRHPVLMKMKTGVTKDGKLTGMHLQTLLDGGGYGSYGVASTFYTGALQTVTYELPRYKFDACRTFTNKPPCGPKRGHGTPQPRFGQEVQLDKIAEKLGLDPAEMRIANMAKPDSLTANWLKIGSIGLEECIRQVVEHSGWKEKRATLAPGRGVGIACGSYLCGAGLPIYWNKMPQSGVQILADRSGQVTVFCGATEIGQGSDDMLAAFVAEVLGIDAFDVRLVTGDTGLTPVDLGSYSSRVTVMMGHAAIQAAERLREMIVDAASLELEVSPERLVMAQGRVFLSEDPSKGMTFAEAVVYAETKYGTLGTVGSYAPPRAPGRFKGAGVGPSPAYSYTAVVVEVEVDQNTGWIHVPKIWVAHDIGRAVNPVLARGQVEGSIYMGLGEALMEEQIFRRLPPKMSHALVHKFPSLLEYKSLTSLDMPEVFTYLVEDPDPNCPFGAKEVGQGPLLPVMPAVANAVYDAVGVRVDEVPITPDKVLRALEREGQGGDAARRPGPLPAGAVPDANLRQDALGRRRRQRDQARGPENGGVAMMRLPWFGFHSPTSVAEAAKILAGEGPQAMLIAGGTDLVPNMKRRHQSPKTLVSLRRVEELKKTSNGSGLRLGAGLSLTEVVDSAKVRENYTGLYQAAAQVATVHLRNMGTLGGNLCLDTRCTYFNQNYEWRKAIDFCMKADGDICWVATASKRCLAVSSTDTAPALISLGAKIKLVSTQGEREVLLADLYRNDGIDYITRRSDEVLTEISLPDTTGWKSTYWKLRRRGAFDFPVLGVAAAVKFAADGTVEQARIALGAVSSRPLATKAGDSLVGKKLTDEAIGEAGAKAQNVAKPMDNTDLDIYWRKDVVSSFVGYALRELRGDDMRETRLRIARQAL